jgi:solute carrier family 25 oxoglutarate transporter 11
MRKILIATVSGAFGAIVGNPFDVALIRKQASINNKSETRYKNTYDAFTRIIKEEGVTGLWTGIKITILRVALINVGQLASKEIIAD